VELVQRVRRVRLVQQVELEVPVHKEARDKRETQATKVRLEQPAQLDLQALEPMEGDQQDHRGPRAKREK